MSLPYVNLPDIFVRLLKINMNHSETTYRKFKEQIWKDQSLQCLMQKCFQDYNIDLGIERHLTSTGWYGVRNRLASLFLYYAQYGSFPTKPQLELVNDVLLIEDKLAPYCVDGIARGFLFGFYLKIGLLQIQDIWPNQKIDDFGFIESDLKIFKFTQAKIIKIDWFIIILKSLRLLLGESEFYKMIENGENYKSIYNRLGENEQKIMNRNLLNYGASINEMEMFTDFSIA